MNVGRGFHTYPCYEELRIIGVWSCIGHGEYAGSIMQALQVHAKIQYKASDIEEDAPQNSHPENFFRRLICR